MDRQPVRPQRGHQRTGVGVEEQPDQHQREHDGREHEQPRWRSAGRAHGEHDVGDDRDEHGGRRELVHVAPGQPVGRQPAGDRTPAWARTPRTVRPIATTPQRRPRGVLGRRASRPGSRAAGRSAGADQLGGRRDRPSSERELRAEGDDGERVQRDRIEKRLSTAPPASRESRGLSSGVSAAGPVGECVGQVVGQGGEPGRALAAAPRERGRASARYRRSPGSAATRAKTRSAAQQQHAEQAGQQRDRRAEHPHLPRVVRELQRGELLVAGEGRPSCRRAASSTRPPRGSPPPPWSAGRGRSGSRSSE